MAQTFIDGETLADGTDVAGSEYNTIVTAAIAGTVPAQTASAYFSELALDPYEVALAAEFI